MSSLPSAAGLPQHTLGECPAWTEERAELTRVVGNCLELPTLVGKMLQNKEAWSAVVKYSERVMTATEKAERERGEEKASQVPKGGGHEEDDEEERRA